MNIELLTEHYLEFQSLKRGCTGLSESTLVKMPRWNSHVTAHLTVARLTFQQKCLLYWIANTFFSKIRGPIETCRISYGACFELDDLNKCMSALSMSHDQTVLPAMQGILFEP